MPDINRYINRTILVSLRTPTEDRKCAPYKLIGVDATGLWLDAPELSRAFIADRQPSDPTTTWKFFVPFLQIACVAVGGGKAAPTRASIGGDETPAPAKQRRPKPKDA